ncbi:MAG: hypothetical protein NVS9B13_01300 [Candidatus Acidiferrum sp.]
MGFRVRNFSSDIQVKEKGLQPLRKCSYGPAKTPNFARMDLLRNDAGLAKRVSVSCAGDG